MTQGIICHSDIKGTGPKMRWKIIPEVRGQCLDVSRFAHVYNKNSEWSLDLIGGYEFSHSLRRCELDQMELQVHNWLKEAGPDESRWIMVKLYVHRYMDHQGSYVIMLPHPGCTSQGAATRMVGKTVFNPRSSRSHAVVMHGCSKAFENLCLRWRSDLRSIKLVWVKSRPKTIKFKRPMFFFSRLIFMDFLWFWPGKTMGSEAAHLLVPGGQRSSSDVESPLRPWHLLLTAGWLLKYVLAYYDHHFWFIYGFSRNHPGEVAHFQKFQH